MPPIVSVPGPKRCVYLIDASIYIFRYYFSMPDRWSSHDGYPTAAVYGYSRWLAGLLARERPVYVAACFDESLGQCFRNQLYPGYKASRVLPDEALAFQLRACRKITELMGVATYASATHEADDLIATLARRAWQGGRCVAVVSRDKDLAQVLRGGDHFWDYPDKPPLAPAAIAERFGVAPGQLADYWALVGDVGDDIPGVPGIGPKTAAALLQGFGSVPALLERLDEVKQLPIRGAASLEARLTASADQVRLMRRLTRLDTRAPLGRRLRLTRIQPGRELSPFAARLGLPVGFLQKL